MQKDAYERDFKKFCLDEEKIRLIKSTYSKKKIEMDRQFLSRSTAAGLKVTLYSTFELTNVLLNSYNFRFVLTRKFNQDSLEVSFIKHISIYN